LEQVKDDDGMAMYLAKQYVGKEFGQDQFKYRISRNSKSPIEDDCPKIGYNYRMMLFYNAMKKDESKRAKMVRWKDFKKMMRIQ
jgi:hypothetical protein